MTAPRLVSLAPRTPAPDAPQSVYALAHRPCAAEHSEPALPPLDPTHQPADADNVRRTDYLRRLLLTGSLSPSRRRLVEIELREALNADWSAEYHRHGAVVYPERAA